ncbi:ABC transporter substrate-binding protein [Microbacterium sp. C23T]
MIRLSVSAALIALAGAVASCTPSAPENLVTFWSFTGIGQGHQVDEFLAANPAASIELSEIGTSAETADALTAALAGGDVPDLVLIQADDLPRFLSVPGAFRDLRDFGAADLGDQYLDWTWKAATARSGEIIGIPTDVGGLSIAYRSDLFAAAGLPTEPEDVAALWTSWEDFIDVGRRFTATSGIPFVDNVSTTIFANTSNQLPVKYYGDDGDLVYATNPDLRDAFDVAVDAHDAGISAGLASFSAGWSAGMAAGRFAVVAAPSWMLRVIRNTAPDTAGDWRIAPAPGVAGNWGGSFLAIPAGARNPEGAWDYIRQMQSPTAQLDHFLAGGPLPAARSAFASEEMGAYTDPFFGTSAIGKVLGDSVTSMPAVTQGEESTVISTAFLRALMAMEEGAVDPDAAWAEALRSVDVVTR